jgi:hypothetical protein
MNPLTSALRARDLRALRGALRGNHEAARSPRFVVEAGGLGWKSGLALLARCGADLNARWRGYRPLHALIQEQPHKERAAPTTARLSCLRWLLAAGADPNLLGGFPPAGALLTAAFVGQQAYVEELRAAGAAVNVFADAALGHTRRVKAAIAADPGVARARDDGGLTALQCCAASRMGAGEAGVWRALLRIAAALLDNGADPNARTQGWSHELDVAYFAASSGQRELFELLLARGADATAALPSAAWQNDTTLGELALQYGARPDDARADAKPLLNQLIQWGRIGSALWLLGRGAGPNVPDAQGWTAMHQAASRGNQRLLKALIEAGGDMTRRDTLGYTPLHVAEVARWRRARQG